MTPVGTGITPDASSPTTRAWMPFKRLPHRVPIKSITPLLSIYRGDFSHSLFKNAQLSFVEFDTTNLTEANFSGANLRGVACNGCELNGALFSAAKLQQSTFTRCHLEGAKFSPAMVGDLNEAKGFISINTDLRGVTFTECDLAGANFEKADLESADLTKARGLTNSQLLEAESIYDAKLPAELNAELAESIKLKKLPH